MKNFVRKILAHSAKGWRRKGIPTRWYSKTIPLDYDPNHNEQYHVETCDPRVNFPNPRVVIIGAGVAGLSAASRLINQGITDITILEALERPGGRIHSSWLGDVVTELGAHWTPDTSFTNPVFNMAAAEDPPQPGIPGAIHTRGLFSRVVDNNNVFPPTITAYHKFREIEQEALELFSSGGNKQRGCLVNFMSLRIQQELHDFPQEHQHDAARIMFGLVHMLMARSAGDIGLMHKDQEGCFMKLPGADVRVPLGFVGSLSPLLRQIPEGAIKYCSPVECIFWGTSQKTGCRAYVRVADGAEYPADYVIVTVSLGVLCRSHLNMFCPPLPAAKVDAMRCLGYGACNKIYLEYCRPFYFFHNGELNFKFSGKKVSSRYGWMEGLKSIEALPSSNHVLYALVVGPEASAMEQLSDEDISEGLTQVLREASGNQNMPYPKSVLRSKWSSDPYFLGAYSYEGKGSDGSARRALGSPIPDMNDPAPPVLFFAGEATMPEYFATVTGARLSGIRDAESILQLTHKYKGPPVPRDDEEPKTQKADVDEQQG